jgi:hypothetical protein
VRVDLSHPGSELGNVVLIDFVSPQGRVRTSSLSQVGVGRALLLSQLQGLVLHQQALSLVSLARAAPLQYDRSQSRLTACATGQCRIAGGQKHQMVEVSTDQA